MDEFQINKIEHPYRIFPNQVVDVENETFSGLFWEIILLTFMLGHCGSFSGNFWTRFTR